jgi:hypothetical protein
MLLQMLRTNKKMHFMRNTEESILDEKITLKKLKWLAKIAYRS